MHVERSESSGNTKRRTVDLTTTVQCSSSGERGGQYDFVE